VLPARVPRVEVGDGDAGGREAARLDGYYRHVVMRNGSCRVICAAATAGADPVARVPSRSSRLLNCYRGEWYDDCGGNTREWQDRHKQISRAGRRASDDAPSAPPGSRREEEHWRRAWS